MISITTVAKTFWKINGKEELLYVVEFANRVGFNGDLIHVI